MKLHMNYKRHIDNESLINTTASHTEEEDIAYVRWLALQISTVLLTLSLVYVNLALFRYEQLVRCVKEDSYSSTGHSDINSTVNDHHQQGITPSGEKSYHSHHLKPKLLKPMPQKFNNTGSHHNYGTLMRLAMLFSSILGSLRFIGETLEIALDNSEIEYCDAIVKFKIVMTVGFVASIYSVLWFRQRLCYDSQFMTHLTSAVTRTASFGVGIFLGIISVSGVVLFLVTRTYGKTKVGCDLVNSTIPPFVGWIVFAGSTILMQVLLLALFIYPVYKHRKASSHSIGQTKSGKNLLSIIRRALTISSVCVVSDLIAAAITIFVETKYNIVPIIAYDVNLVLNLFAILLSFTTWRMRLFPFYYYDYKRMSAKIGVQKQDDPEKVQPSSSINQQMSTPIKKSNLIY